MTVDAAQYSLVFLHSDTAALVCHLPVLFAVAVVVNVLWHVILLAPYITVVFVFVLPLSLADVASGVSYMISSSPLIL